jgi:hypothetical protein
MPRYTILDLTTKKETEVEMTYDDLITILALDKNIQQVFTKMNYAYRIGKLPVSDAWRSKLKAMKKANPNSTIEIP